MKADLRIDRLCTALQAARQSQRHFREQRVKCVRRYAGPHWSEETSRDPEEPVNLIALWVSILSRSLIADRPRCLLSTFDRGQKPSVKTMQAWGNDCIQKTQLDDVLLRAVIDALFGMGIVHVGLATPEDAAVKAWNLQAGYPFAQTIDLDDFVWDHRCNNFKEWSFAGYRYRAPLELARNNKKFNAAARKKLQATTLDYNFEGDERIGVMGRGYSQADVDYEEMCDLWRIYLPRHRVWVTLADDQISGEPDDEPLLVEPYIGPDAGPFHILAFDWVPGNPFPKPPVLDLLDLHDSTNRLYKKLMDQAERQKEVIFVAGGSTEDGSRLVDAPDGTMWSVAHPQNIIPTKWGGPNNEVHVFAEGLRNIFSWVAGNLDMMGGLSPQSKTLGQDRMLEENSSRGVAAKQARTIEFTSRIIEAKCWYWWYHPTLVMRSDYSAGAASVRREVGPQQRGGAMPNVEVDPYSLQHSTPQTRLSGLMQIVTQIYIPLAQVAQAKGIDLDFHAFFRVVGEYMNQPDVAELLTISDPPQSPNGQSNDTGPTMPQKTQRDYVRHNVPMRSETGDRQNLMNALRGVETGGATRKGGEPRRNGKPVGVGA